MERRHTRRLLRYWVFVSIAYLFGMGAFIYFSFLHGVFSSISASIGMIGPRFLLGVIATYYLFGYIFCIVFLGFDIRARDVRENIAEVLDSRPLTNLELIAGRYLALLLSSWIPIVILVLLIQGLGWLLPAIGSPIGMMVEPVSILTFVIAQALPAIAFITALVFAVTLLVRHRLIAAIVSVAAIAALFWGLATLPLTHVAWVDFLGSAEFSFPSDFVPDMLVPGGWIQRIAVLLLAFGLVGIAAVVHPRLDGHDRVRPAAISGALLIVGLAGLWTVTQQRQGAVDQLHQWRSAHEARADEPVVDVLSISGTAVVEPGRNLAADLQLELQAPAGQTLDSVLLTLNPGFEVGEVSSAGGQPLTATHADGLLEIELNQPLVAGARAVVNLNYSGAPDTGFGYLDSVLEVETLNTNEAQIGILGYERGLFDSRYVALMPGIGWLPASGVDVGRDDPRTRAPDYFRFDLEVDVPSDWLVAGPGRRETVSSSDDRAVFRFTPDVSVPEVALMASEFSSFATEIEGINFEVLVHPDHDRNFEVLAHAREEIEQWVAERIEFAREAGIEYPFDAFTMVEVPTTLRSYEGGWRLDTALAPPGMMLLRESGFPTSQFGLDIASFVFAGGATSDPDQEGGQARIDRDRLVSFFSNDFSGGNIFTGAARSFFAYQTSAVGPEAIALNFALEELATLLVSGQRSYFSVHLFSNINLAATSVINNIQGENPASVTDALIIAQTNLTDVWTAALESGLGEMDPWEDPQLTIDMLTLKGGQMAEVIYDTLGPDAVSELLATLLDNHAGGSFTLDELVAAGSSVDEDLGPLLADWFGSEGMPGFLASDAELYRLPDSESGDAQYQMLLRVTNGEPVVGFTRIGWAMGGDAAGANPVAGLTQIDSQALGDRTFSDPIRIEGESAIEFGVVLSEPVAAVYVHPYLSLNREDFLVEIFGGSQIPTRDVEPFTGVRSVEVGASSDDRIVADDLDEGFQIDRDDESDNLRLAGSDEGPVPGMDQGLPSVYGGTLPNDWSRRHVTSAWGTYRHTLAYMAAGNGSSRAVLPASIPADGIWELEIHQPFLQYVAPQNRGVWNLEIVSDYGREAVSYDATVGVVGWNSVGEFDLPAGEVRVEISDATDGALVVADAVAWSPVRVRGQAITDETDE